MTEIEKLKTEMRAHIDAMNSLEFANKKRAVREALGPATDEVVVLYKEDEAYIYAPGHSRIRARFISKDVGGLELVNFNGGNGYHHDFASALLDAEIDNNKPWWKFW